LFECEFERNAAAFGAVLVLIVFLFPFAHGGPYWLRMILTRCRAGGTKDPYLLREVLLAPFQHPVDTRPANAERLSYLGGASSLGTLLLAPRVNGRPHEGWQTEKLMLQSPASQAIEGPVIATAAAPGWIVGPISGPPRPFVATPRSRE
jgi:hypothetical protein